MLCRLTETFSQMVRRQSHALQEAQQLRGGFLEAARNGTAMAAAHRRMRQLRMPVSWQPLQPHGAPGPSSDSASPSICTNLHGVLRAPRGDGTETLLLITPLGGAEADGTDALGTCWHPHNWLAPLMALTIGCCHI